MKVCLVGPPTVPELPRGTTESEAILRLTEQPPIGVLALASVLRREGIEVAVVDANDLYYDFVRLGSPTTTGDDFGAFASAAITELDFDVVGLGSICSSYPWTLRLADRLRRSRPDAPIILGGPQATVVDARTLELFPAVDVIVRNEAEETLPVLLDALDRGHELTDLEGISFRRRGGVVRSPSAGTIRDLDSLPLPAYDLYPHIDRAEIIPLEIGRGCPYACTFCSTNDFFRRRFRLKSAGLVVAQMNELRAAYGVGTFDLIHDMFTVNRDRVVEFCEEMLAADEDFSWSCSARTDRVDEELLELMAAAGCHGLFFGIESGSERLQGSIQKKLDLDSARQMIATANRHRLRTKVSLIMGFPDEQERDLRQTAAFFVDSLRYDDASPQLHILAPLADTPLHREHAPELTFDDIGSDMSHMGWGQEPEDLALIQDHPEIFPNFYAFPTALDRELLKSRRGFLSAAARSFRWVLIALHQERAHITDITDGFDRWRLQYTTDPPHGASIGSYYPSERFRREFADFVAAEHVDDTIVGECLRALLDFSMCFLGMAAEDHPVRSDSDSRDPGPEPTRAGEPVPRRAPGVVVVDVGVEFGDLLRRLREHLPLTDVKRARRTLAYRHLPGHWPEVIQLSQLSGAVLELCDGERTVSEIGESLEDSAIGLGDSGPEAVAVASLGALREHGLLVS